MKQVAVIMVAHGEAESDGFLENYAMIRHTFAHAAEVMELPAPVQLLASFAGALKNRRSFRKRGFCSPQNPITRRQAEQLRQQLDRLAPAAGIRFDVQPAFHATPPFVDEVHAAAAASDLRVLVSLSPVDSRLTAGTLHLLAERGGTPTVVLDGFWKDEALRRVEVDQVFRYGSTQRERALLLAFHGTLVRDAKGREPSFHTGLEEIGVMGEALRRAVLADGRNAYGRVEITHLNHTVGGSWTTPSLEESLEALAGSGFEEADLFCCGYFSDGTETLLHARDAGEASRLSRVEHLPCLNESEAFAAYLAERVLGAL